MVPAGGIFEFAEQVGGMRRAAAAAESKGLCKVAALLAAAVRRRHG